jgi:hypothetical protein
VKIDKLTQELKLAGLQEHKNRKQMLWRTEIPASFSCMKTTGLFIISHSIILRMRNVSDKVVKEMKKKLCSITLFENRAIWKIMWKNIVERGRPQMTIWRMRIACWIPKARHTHTQYAILIVFPPQQWL